MSQKATEKKIVDLHDLYIFNRIKNLIREKINNINKFYCGSIPQKKEIMKIIKKTVQCRENNSVILCGPPGCGKTTLIKYAISQLKIEKIINDENTLLVHLSGLLHTDDRLAFKDIIKQMHFEEKCDFDENFSYQENLVLLFNKLRDLKQNDDFKKCIIFILDEFHLFCGHKNQILLYNLFDLVHSSLAVCVIGLTYYSDITNLLEKRVLSRFSHRIIWLSNHALVEERLKIFKFTFSFNDGELKNIEKIYEIIWNARVQDLAKNTEVIETFKGQLEQCPSLNNYKNILVKLLNSITFEKPLLTAESIKKACTTLDYYIEILGNLTTLEMALVIVIKHYSVTYERKPFNFEIIYSQYLKFTKKYSTTLITEKCVVLKGFQRLEEFEIIVSIKNSVTYPEKTPFEYRFYNFTLTSEQVSEGVKLKDFPVDLNQWLNNE